MRKAIEPRPLAQRLEPGADGVDAALVDMGIADMRLGGRLELDGPARQVVAAASDCVSWCIAEASLRISPASTTRLRVRIAAVSGSLRTVSIGPAHAGDALAQALPERPQLAAVVGQRIEAFLEDGDDVEQAVEIALEEGGRRHRPIRCRRPTRR